MEWLALTDVEQVVHLVSWAADPTVEIPIPERKRLLLEGVAKLVSADIWVWHTTVFSSSVPGDAMATNLINGGWISEQEPAKFMEALLNPELRPAIGRLYDFCRDHHLTLLRESLPYAEDLQAIDTAWASIGIGHFLLSVYPLGENASSAVGFYRRLGKPAFTGRDRAVAHVVISQVDWLHRHGVDVRAKEKILMLSTRERQVTAFLLGGDSIKEVARKLEISEHTVGDYVKQIYKHFDVNSRAELLSHFIAGGQR